MKQRTGANTAVTKRRDGLASAAVEELALAPPGLRLKPDPDLRRLNDDRLLIGGVPLRILKLTDHGARTVRSWIKGKPVADGMSERKLARRLLDASVMHPVTEPGSVDQITVVVPVRDNITALTRLLAGLSGMAVVVVDDGSDDHSETRAITDQFGARLIRHQTSHGPGQARMTGLVEVTTPVVAFVDVDVLCSANDLSLLAGHFVNAAVAAVAPRVRSEPGISLLARYERCFSPLDLGPNPAPVGPGRSVSYIPSAVLVARTRAVRDVGGFDPALRHGEDVDLVWRLIDAGVTVRYAPEVVVTHLPRPSWRAWIVQRHNYGSSAAPLARRHGRAIAPAVCSRESAMVWALVLSGRPKEALTVAGQTVRNLLDAFDGAPESLAESLRLAVRGHLSAGRGLASATGRVWWPLASVAALASKRLRVVVALAVLAGPVLEYIEGRRPADPIRTISLRVLDHAAYGWGVWRGMIRERTLVPLIPTLKARRGTKRPGPDTVGVL